MRPKFNMAAFALSTALALLCAEAAVAADEIQLQDTPPDVYTVQKGDTLWSIAGRFLKQPWRWPEVWRMNRDQLKNPHWIYPGDRISLSQINGQWQLSLQRNERTDTRLSPTVRVEPLQSNAIPSIPPGDIEAYLTRPLISDTNDLPGAAQIVAARDGRVVRGLGDSMYAVGIDPALGDQWAIYRPGKLLHAYDSKEILGYEMRYLGTAHIDRFGEVSTIRITGAREEIQFGDLMVPSPREQLVNYVPHAPGESVEGRIIDLFRDAAEGGRGQIVTLDRGSRDSIEVGHVLAIYHPAPVIADPRPYDGPNIMSRLFDRTQDIIPPTRYLEIPPERSGLLFVFRVFDKVSYAIVLNSTEPVIVGDLVRKP